MTLQIIVASTRDGRLGHLVGEWFEEIAREHGGFELELIDLAEIALPLFDEPRHPRLAQYEHDHTKEWSEIISRADAFVVVTPEYDYAPPSSLVNAMQFLVQEWAYKPVGFVSYGGVSGGTRGVEVTKQIMTAQRMVPVVEAVAIPFFREHVDEEAGTFNPGEVQVKAARAMLDELLKLSGALRTLRV